VTLGTGLRLWTTSRHNGQSGSMTTAVQTAPDTLDGLYAVRERVQRRLDEAAPYSPDWAAASEYADEIDREIDARFGRRNLEPD